MLDEFKSIEEHQPDWSDFACADTYLSERGDTLVYQCQILYIYDSERVRWKEDRDGIGLQNDVNLYLKPIGTEWRDRWQGLCMPS